MKEREENFLKISFDIVDFCPKNYKEVWDRHFGRVAANRSYKYE
ncbi:hypothetical protein C900_02811 [Fulvivirga imtechensis AK7]|uniref:Uncharacterized protein n=1 Tax=Fulvivirga imtechensis AK7 TaxID=1237149 RepID=L8JT28_9BACT|nr:hypothetical protein C900_02811 [Fulvivirga imtechensis AK7]